MNSPSVSPRYTFSSYRLLLYICISRFPFCNPTEGTICLTLQLHSRVSCVSFWTIFLLCPLIICDMFWVQLWLTLAVFLLKILGNLLEWRRCFPIKFKNIFATLVDTYKLSGGLNKMILRCRFLLTLFCLWLGGIYVNFVVCPHFFSASSYSNLH